MEAFSIQCTTCKSRLSVKSAAAIGQIIACPKCGGMVLVKAPAAPQSSDPGDTRPDQSSPMAVRARQHRPGDTLAPDAFDDIDSILNSSAPARNAPPLPPKGAQPAAQVPPPSQPKRVAQPGPSASGVKLPVPSASVAAPTANQVAPGSPTPPVKAASLAAAAQPGGSAAQAPRQPAPNPAYAEKSAEKVSPASASEAAPSASSEPAGESPPAVFPAPTPWRLGVWVTASLALGVALAVGVVCVTIIWSNGRDQQTAGRSLPLPQIPAVPAPAVPSPAGVNTAEQPPVPAPAVPVIEAPIEPAPMPPETVVAENAPPPVPNPPPPGPERDPLGLTDPPGPNPPAKPRPLAPGADPLQQFDNILRGDAADPLNGAAGEAKPKPAGPPPGVQEEPAPAVSAPEGPEAPEVRRPEPRVVDVAARLADPLDGIELNGVPLADFLGVIQDLTGAPVTLSTDSLLLRNVRPDRQLQFQSGPASVEVVLAQALTPLGLKAVREAGQIVVDVAPPPAGSTLPFPVGDLVADDEQVEELAGWLTSLVAADAWRDGSAVIVEKSPQAFSLRCSPAVQAQAVLFLQKLRVARGKSPLGRLDPNFFVSQPRSEQAARQLEVPVTLNFGQSSLLTTILQRLGRSAGLRVLVDWRSLSLEGWNPDAEATLRVAQVPTGEALSQLLSPLGLTYRVIDSRTVEVLTQRDAAQRMEIECYPAGDLLGGDATGAGLLAKLSTALGPGVLRENGGTGELAFDPLSKHLFAALPQPQQKRLAAVLFAQREASKAAPVAAAK